VDQPSKRENDARAHDDDDDDDGGGGAVWLSPPR